MRRVSLLSLLLACGGPADPGTDDPSTPPVTPDDSDPAAVDSGEPVDPPPAEVACHDVGGGWCEKGVGVGLGDSSDHGTGLVVADFDNDGWDDVLDCNSGASIGGRNRTKLYMNRGDGTFYVASAGIDPRWTHGCFGLDVGDYDGDGDLDVLVLPGGYFGDSRIRLLRNDFATTGGFTDVTEAAGLTTTPRNWWAGAFADADGDGCLDFVAVARHGRPALYMSRCDGTFVDEAEARGIDVHFTPGPNVYDGEDGKNPTWIDHDLDGDLDLFIAGDADLNAFYRNDGGQFTNVTRQAFPQAGIVWSRDVTPEDDAPVFTVSVADFDQDGWPDLYLGRYYLPDIVAFNKRDGTFEFWGPSIGLDHAPNPPGGYTPENSMGLTVADIDGDGWPDAMIGTGTPAASFDDVVFCNRGPREGQAEPTRFERCSAPFVRGHGPQRTHGIALADLDRDGRRDLVWNFGGFALYDVEYGVDSSARNHVYEDTRERPPKMATLRLYGTRGDREAIGARVEVVHTTRHYLFVTSSQGFQSTSSRQLMLPLGDSDEADVTVRWLDGQESTLRVRAGERVEMFQPGAPGVRPPVLPRPAEATLFDDAILVWRPPVPDWRGQLCGVE